jgi:pimeloyl-ACP methyl ester carboxylesterase
MERLSTSQIEIAFDVHGRPGRQLPLLLLHGFPDDASSWRRVGERLAAAGRQAFAPYVRGCGPTRFRSPEVPRSGQPASRGRDVLELMDALGLDRVIVVGQDWGAVTALALALLHRVRVERLVILNGHGLLNLAVLAQGRRPTWATLHAGWYQWMFQTPLGQPLLEADRAGFIEYVWGQWSPGWNPPPEELAEVVRSAGNPDWTAVVLSAYRPGNADPAADPRDADAGQRLASAPPITRPTLNLQGARDGVDLFADTQLGQEAFYRGGFERAVLEGCGHFLHRERPEAVAERILDFVADR